MIKMLSPKSEVNAHAIRKTMFRGKCFVMESFVGAIGGGLVGVASSGNSVSVRNGPPAVREIGVLTVIFSVAISSAICCPVKGPRVSPRVVRINHFDCSGIEFKFIFLGVSPKGAV